jgi:hypothetical protein
VQLLLLSFAQALCARLLIKRIAQVDTAAEFSFLFANL